MFPAIAQNWSSWMSALLGHTSIKAESHIFWLLRPPKHILVLEPLGRLGDPILLFSIFLFLLFLIFSFLSSFFPLFLYPPTCHLPLSYTEHLCSQSETRFSVDSVTLQMILWQPFRASTKINSVLFIVLVTSFPNAFVPSLSCVF